MLYRWFVVKFGEYDYYRSNRTTANPFRRLNIISMVAALPLVSSGCLQAPEITEEVSASWNLSSYQEVFGEIEINLSGESVSGLDSLTISLDGSVVAGNSPSGSVEPETLQYVWDTSGLPRGSIHTFEARISDTEGDSVALASKCIVIDSESILPLGDGNRWEYEGEYRQSDGYNEWNDQFQWVMEVAGTLDVTDTTIFLVGNDEGEPIYDYHLNFDDGLYYFGLWDYGDQETPDAPLIVWKYPHESPGNYYSGYFGDSVTVVSVSESVSVPAGTFDSCIHYRRTKTELSLEPAGFSPKLTARGPTDEEYFWQADYYFKPGVGCIRMEFYTEYEGLTEEETDELSDYMVY